jgi:hypothetical protein
LLPPAELSAWLERYLAPRWQTLFCQGPLSVTDNRTGARWLTRTNVGLGTPNWTQPPEELRMGALYWPTGASRFGFFLGMCEEGDLDKIIAKLDSDGKGDLSLGDGEGLIHHGAERFNIVTNMHLLPPRPISRPDKGLKGWLLPLVDERYFWQFQDFDINVLPGLPTNYPGYDSVEFNRLYFNNAGVLLDAHAASIGRRVTLLLTGEVRTLPWTTSLSALTTNVEETYQSNLGKFTSYLIGEIAGGPREEKFQRLYVPSTVTVVFTRFVPGPESIDQITGVNFDSYAYTKQASAYGFSTDQVTTLFSKTFFSSCRADFATDAATPVNNTELDALAGQIASDYYASLKRQYDYCFAGIVNWVPCGYDDWIVWYAGARCDDGDPSGEYLGQTRVISMPYNFGVTELLHESAVATTSRERNELHQFFPFELTSSLSAGFSSCTGQNLQKTGDDPDGDNFTKVGNSKTYYDDFWGSMTGSPGDKGWWFWYDSRRVILFVEC